MSELPAPSGPGPDAAASAPSAPAPVSPAAPTSRAPAPEAPSDASDGGTEATGARPRSRSRRGKGRSTTTGDGEDASTRADAGSSSGEPERPDADASSSETPERRPRRSSRAGSAGARSSADGDATALTAPFGDERNPELPDRHIEGRPKSVEAAERALVPRKPRIGDTMPAPASVTPPSAPLAAGRGAGGAAGAPSTTTDAGDDAGDDGGKRSRRRGGRGRGGARKTGDAVASAPSVAPQPRTSTRGGGRGAASRPVEQVLYDDEPLDLDEKALSGRRGRERKGRPVGRYVMCVHVGPKATQIAVLEGRSLVEHYVSRPADDVSEIHGNVYLGKVQNVLPGMEAAFVDIGTPKNAVLYRGDVHYDQEDLEPDGKRGGGHGHGNNANRPRIEQVLRARQTIVCQVTKNPIAHKGARLTQEVSLPGRFVVLIPNSSTYGISKRLPDNERKRLRQILDRVKPPQHGVIVRTAAENVTEEEIERDVRRLADQWEKIETLAKRSTAPALLYREPDLALRVIREEFNAEYRQIIIDEPRLFEEVRSYVAAISPTLADRVEYFDRAAEPLPLFERHHVHEQRLRALDRKVWLPSGGSLIIEHTEALTVIDVNTGKNVGSSSLEETVFRNNLEAAEEIARQLRLRDIGGIIVIDFVDMESKDNREEVVRVFRDGLARDKTRTQVFDISELGLVEMTRKRIGEGLIESVSHRCAICEGRGLTLDEELVGEDAP